MYREPRLMREVHDIQRKLYEEERDLTNEELIAKIHREAQEAIKKYALKFKKHSPIR